MKAYHSGLAIADTVYLQLRLVRLLASPAGEAVRVIDVRLRRERCAGADSTNDEKEQE